MNYKEARKLYFEDYVEFENLIFNLLEAYKNIDSKIKVEIIYTEGQRLSDAIHDLFSLVISKKDNFGKHAFYYQGIAKRYLLKYKGYRNDLAHKHGAIDVSAGIEKDLGTVVDMNRKLNSLLINILNKK